jgi:asparagine synthase (glutamine-hydrolysing)
VRQVWAAHLGGQRNHEYMLWNVLMFEAWRQRWG